MSREIQDNPPLVSSRRQFIRVGVSAAAATWVSGLVQWPATAPGATTFLTPLAKAYRFLQAMMDLHGSGSTLRLVQSYQSTPQLNLGDVGFLYDNAVLIIALLARGQSNDLSRAVVLGNSLLYAQDHDTFLDGRLRDGYHTNPFLLAGSAVNVAGDSGFGGSDTGNLAWAGMSLMQLYKKTKDARYLNAAVNLANFIDNNTYDTRGAGGYTGGLTESQARKNYKATEHNIDLFGFFTMLADATRALNWSQNATHAIDFVKAMWNSAGSFFWTGTLEDGTTLNRYPVPEDAQTWSYLSTGLSQYQRSIDWAATNLAAKDGTFSGISFSQTDTSGVWFEGTAHVAAALRKRNLFGDSAKAAVYLKDIEVGQASAPNTDGNCIVAASKNGLQTGFGFNYFAAPHIGATAWYCLAKQAANPFHLL